MRTLSWLPAPVLSLLMLVVWLMMVGTVAPGQVLLGLILAIGIPLLIRPFLDDLPIIKSPGKAIRLILVVTYDIVVANITVARLVLGPQSKLRPVFVEVPLEVTHAQSITLLASIITMTPGTVSADLSEDRTRLLVHVLDGPDPDGVVSDIKQRYEKPLLEIFGC